MKKPDDAVPETYSPFWPLQILLVSVIIYEGAHFYWLNDQRLASSDILVQMQEQAKTSNVSFERVYILQKRLMDLAASGNKNAEAILQRHHLTQLPLVDKSDFANP